MKDPGQLLHRERQCDAALLAILPRIEVHQVRSRDLISHLGIVGPELTLHVECLARLGGLAFAQQQQGFPERVVFSGSGSWPDMITAASTAAAMLQSQARRMCYTAL